VNARHCIAKTRLRLPMVPNSRLSSCNLQAAHPTHGIRVPNPGKLDGVPIHSPAFPRTAREGWRGAADPQHAPFNS
jgi:hypothetical protein